MAIGGWGRGKEWLLERQVVGKCFLKALWPTGWRGGWVVVLGRGWMDEDVLLGLLLCKTNDAMNKSLLLAIVNSEMKGKIFYIRRE